MTKILDFNGSPASGSLGQIVYSRNQFGPYTRARTTPTQPNTTKQTQARTDFSNRVDFWRNNMTAEERQEWNTYAANVPIKNSLGQTIHLSGFQMWMRNSLLVTGSGLLMVAGPTQIYSLGDTDPNAAIISFIDTATTFELAFDDQMDWVTTDGAGLRLQIGQPYDTTRNFFAGPWQTVDVILGNSVTPPTSPATVSVATSTYIFPGGMQVQARLNIIRPIMRCTSQWATPPFTISL